MTNPRSITALQATALNHAYWASCGDTHLADGAYYRRVRDILPLLCDLYLSPQDHALDIGCGNGEYTQHIAARCRQVRAFDLSPKLVEQARARAASNIDFRCADVAGLAEHRDVSFDAVFAMGVFVIIHGERFATAMADLAALVRPGGVLITRDSVTPSEDVMRQIGDGYIAHYRSAQRFVGTIGDAGFKLERTVFIEQFKEMTNSFYVFRRA
jgi:2-polyprenyl-3-methyl-5-hydroxy-6-metoxy-1,4-benzoquinol methylase